MQNKTISFLSYIFSTYTHILYPWVSILSMFHFLETDRREQQKYEKRTQKYVDNTLNDKRHKNKFEICEKHHHSIALAFFLQTQILKIVDMPQQKPQ